MAVIRLWDVQSPFMTSEHWKYSQGVISENAFEKWLHFQLRKEFFTLYWALYGKFVRFSLGPSINTKNPSVIVCAKAFMLQHTWHMTLHNAHCTWHCIMHKMLHNRCIVQTHKQIYSTTYIGADPHLLDVLTSFSLNWIVSASASLLNTNVSVSLLNAVGILNGDALPVWLDCWPSFQQLHPWHPLPTSGPQQL